jgi:hypothetical protein
MNIENKDLQNNTVIDNRVSITYIKMNDIKYKGYQVYYKKSIDNIMTKATEFNEHFKYFYKQSDSIVIKSMGKYKGYKIVSSECRYYDGNYHIYEFEEGNISTDKKECIYCIEIPIIYNNMILIDDITYEQYSLYYRDE